MNNVTPLFISIYPTTFLDTPLVHFEIRMQKWGKEFVYTQEVYPDFFTSMFEYVWESAHRAILEAMKKDNE
jgi:hypothetical protein